MFFYRNEECRVTSKEDFIETAHLIAKESQEVVRMARKIASLCTDEHMRNVSTTYVRY